MVALQADLCPQLFVMQNQFAIGGSSSRCIVGGNEEPVMAFQVTSIGAAIRWQGANASVDARSLAPSGRSTFPLFFARPMSIRKNPFVIKDQSQGLALRRQT
jgi:hypothetical protein